MTGDDGDGGCSGELDGLVERTEVLLASCAELFDGATVSLASGSLADDFRGLENRAVELHETGEEHRSAAVHGCAMALYAVWRATSAPEGSANRRALVHLGERSVEQVLTLSPLLGLAPTHELCLRLLSRGVTAPLAANAAGAATA